MTTYPKDLCIQDTGGDSLETSIHFNFIIVLILTTWFPNIIGSH